MIFDTIKQDCLSCNRCSLHEARIGDPVTFSGPTNSKIMIIGEAPGEEEELFSKPFIGPAGEKLNEWLNWIKVSPSSIYITNTVKCRPVNTVGPSKNFTPFKEHIQACNYFLSQEIEQLNPKVIVLFGRTAAQALGFLKPGSNIQNIINTVYTYKGSSLLIMKHPASLLYAKRDPDKYNLLREEYKNGFIILKGLIDFINS